MSTRQTRSTTAHLRQDKPPENQASAPKSTAQRKKTRIARPVGETQSVQSTNKLSSLPPEIEDMILGYIQDAPTIGKLARTCKRYYARMVPQLHQRVAVAAMFHAHIPKLIRALEPYLSIAQKVQLKKEGKYKGQQSRYSKLLQRDEIPECATFVRQLIFGVVDPGRKHQAIVYRYLEESLQNLDNLEIVEICTLTPSIAERVASLERLRALSLQGNRFSDDITFEVMAPLKRIKNLQVLSIEGSDFDVEGTWDVVQTMLINSISTLKSLCLNGWSYELSGLPRDWEKRVSAAGASPHFDSLEDLTIVGYADPDFVEWLGRTVDTGRLRELEIGYVGEDDFRLLQHFQDAMRRAGSPSLQNFSLNAQHVRPHWESSAVGQAWYTALCDFLSSFTTLKSLELKNLGHYNVIDTPEPTLPESLWQVIRKHEGLRCLRIQNCSRGSNQMTPTLSADVVARILQSLPDLEEFEFDPEESEIERVGEALYSAARLSTIDCLQLGDTTDEDVTAALRKLLTGILSQVNNDGTAAGRFIWEHHSKLRYVTLYQQTWELASSFGRSGKGIKKPEKHESNGHEVFFRNITGTIPHPIHVGFDPKFKFVKKAAQICTV